jgi:predicted AAA+ superfamily ATPase
MWINRDIIDSITNNRDPIQVLRGPRQCGKSSLCLRLGPDFTELSFDDINLRQFAQTDPEGFLAQFEGKKIFIDEAQYAPNLFPALKRKVDLYKRNVESSKRQTIVRLTGSNHIQLDTQIKESLAGRASFFDLNTLSVSEILGQVQIPLQQILYTGGWPELYASSPVRDPKKYLDDYIQSYIEKDVIISAGIQKKSNFFKFLKLLGGRVSQLADFSSLGKECEIDSKTAKDWASVLEHMNIIALVPSYSNNLTSRLVKTPKIYFLDTGLACRLQGWTSSDPIATSPQQGPLFKNLVFSELYRLNQNFQLGWSIYHWRSKDGEEIDFYIDRGQTTHLFVEAKTSAQSLQDHTSFREVKKVFGENIPPRILCHLAGSQTLKNQVPISQLKSYLLAAANVRAI